MYLNSSYLDLLFAFALALAFGFAFALAFGAGLTSGLPRGRRGFGLPVPGLPGATAGPGFSFGLEGAGAFSTIVFFIILRSTSATIFLFILFIFVLM
jgi:hypothetical protein